MNATCVLAVGDNELGMGDDNDTLLEAATWASVGFSVGSHG